MTGVIEPSPKRSELCFRDVMFNAQRRSAATLNNNLGTDGTVAHEMLLRAVRKKQMANKVGKKHHVVESKMSDIVERSPKVEKKKTGVVQRIVKTRRRVVLKN